jgi:hypothetical protein
MLSNTKSPITHNVYRANLKKKISTSQKQTHETINAAGLLTFVFRLSSRREINRELTGECYERLSSPDAPWTCNECAFAIYEKIKKVCQRKWKSCDIEIYQRTLFSPWLPDVWHEEQYKQISQLRFLME